MRINLTKSVTDVSWGYDQRFHLSSSLLQPISKTTTDVVSVSSMQQCITLGLGNKVISKPKPEITTFHVPDVSAFTVPKQSNVSNTSPRDDSPHLSLQMVPTHIPSVSDTLNTTMTESTLSAFPGIMDAASRSFSSSSDIYSQNTSSIPSTNLSTGSESEATAIPNQIPMVSIHNYGANVVTEFDSGTFDD